MKSGRVEWYHHPSHALFLLKIRITLCNGHCTVVYMSRLLHGRPPGLCMDVPHHITLDHTNSDSAFGITAYTAGIAGIMAEFEVSMTTAISGMSLYLLGLALAPIYTPHLAERYGRSILYLSSLFLFILFVFGVSRSPSFTGVAICRFLAGCAGGPCLVLIEGTFSDVWSSTMTSTYYALLALAPYIGTAYGTRTEPFSHDFSD